LPELFGNNHAHKSEAKSWLLMEHAKIAPRSEFAAHFDEFGYVVLQITHAELEILRNLVTSHYTEIVRETSRLDACEAQLRIQDHHLTGGPDLHSRIEAPSTRLLPPESVKKIHLLPFMAVLRELVGLFWFGCVQQIYQEEVTWRVTRPNRDEDVGPWHTDKSFWDLGIGAGSEPVGWVERLKLWVPLHSEWGKNGLAIVPGSHRRQVPHVTEFRHGRYKPIYTGDIEAEPQTLISGDDGRAVLFHDALLHRGIPNRGRHCRVSFDATIFTLNSETASAELDSSSG
jgi:hypothetical protein